VPDYGCCGACVSSRRGAEAAIAADAYTEADFPGEPINWGACYLSPGGAAEIVAPVDGLDAWRDIRRRPRALIASGTHRSVPLPAAKPEVSV